LHNRNQSLRGFEGKADLKYNLKNHATLAKTISCKLQLFVAFPFSSMAAFPKYLVEKWLFLTAWVEPIEMINANLRQDHA